MNTRSGPLLQPVVDARVYATRTFCAELYIAGTRTSPQPQQLAVLPIQRHRMIPQKVTSASVLKASQAHIWAQKSCVPSLACGNGYSAWQSVAKGCDVILIIKGCGLTVFTSGPVSRCLLRPCNTFHAHGYERQLHKGQLQEETMPSRSFYKKRDVVLTQNLLF